MSYKQGMNRNQVTLLPKTVEEYVTDNNQVRFIEVFIENLNLLELGFSYAGRENTLLKGQPSYAPADMLKLYVYGYLNKIRSSRNLEKECHRNLELIWLMRNLAPDFKTIADFRKNNTTGIRKVFKEFVILCKNLDLFGGELIAIDGSKFKAVNSRKKNFNRKKIEKMLVELDETIEKYMSELEENDKKEAKIKIPAVEDLKRKIEKLENQKEYLKQLDKQIEESGETQVSLTDPDARLMKDGQKMDVCYNVQVTIDAKHKLMLDYEATNETDDHFMLAEMSNRAKEILGVEKIEALADTGYYNQDLIKDCVDNGITPYVPEPADKVRKDGIPAPEYSVSKFKYDHEKDIYLCPCRQELTYRGKSTFKGRVLLLYKTKACNGCPKRDKCTKNKQGRVIYRWEHEEILEKMRKRVKEEKIKYKSRQQLCEHPFGTIKRAFNQGYMLMKGLQKTNAEFGLTGLAYNIKRVTNIFGGTQNLIQAMG